MNQYITFEQALSDTGAALLARDLETEQVRGEITYSEYLHLKREQILVFEYRGMKERLNPTARAA